MPLAGSCLSIIASISGASEIGSRSLLPLEVEASEIEPSLTLSLCCTDSWLLPSASGMYVLGCFRCLMRLGLAGAVYAMRSGDVAPSRWRPFGMWDLVARDVPAFLSG